MKKNQTNLGKIIDSYQKRDFILEKQIPRKIV